MQPNDDLQVRLETQRMDILDDLHGRRAAVFTSQSNELRLRNPLNPCETTQVTSGSAVPLRPDRQLEYSTNHQETIQVLEGHDVKFRLPDSVLDGGVSNR